MPDRSELGPPNVIPMLGFVNSSDRVELMEWGDLHLVCVLLSAAFSFSFSPTELGMIHE